MTNEELTRRLSGETQQSLMAFTYYALRWGLAVIAFLLAPVVAIGESVLTKHALPESISGYYHTGMRNYFEASLIVIGSFLFLYKGFSRLENYLLNLAGAATIIIAFFPTSCDKGATECATFTAPVVHTTSALIAFGSIGVVAIFLGGSTLDLLGKPKTERVFRLVYRVLGVAMIGFPLLTWLLVSNGVGFVYWIELVALWVFVAYWIVKTVEFRMTHAEVKALRGEMPPP